MQEQHAEMPPMQTHGVMALGRRARWLSCGYWLLVLYYIGIAALIARHGIRFSSFALFAEDIVRLSSVLAQLSAYIVVTAAIATCLIWFVPLHTAARWGVAVVAIVLALIAAGLYTFSIIQWVEAGRPHGLSQTQIIGLALTLGYLVLAVCVTWLTRRLHGYVRVNGIWLARLRTP